LGLLFRADQFDRNEHLASVCSEVARKTASEDRVTTFGGGLLVFFSEELKSTVVYAHVREQGARLKGNDVATLQLQARF
jgi:hypothetical protein